MPVILPVCIIPVRLIIVLLALFTETMQTAGFFFKMQISIFKIYVELLELRGLVHMHSPVISVPVSRHENAIFGMSRYV